MVHFFGVQLVGVQNLITSHSELNAKMFVGSGPDVFTLFPVCLIFGFLFMNVPQTCPLALFFLLSDFLSPALFPHVSSVNCVLAVLLIILFPFLSLSQRWAGNDEMSRRGWRKRECVCPVRFLMTPY